MDYPSFIRNQLIVMMKKLSVCSKKKKGKSNPKNKNWHRVYKAACVENMAKKYQKNL